MRIGLYLISCVFLLVPAGVESAEIQHLWISIDWIGIKTPPWWNTWWAFLVIGFLVIAGLYILRRYELNRIKLRNQLKLEKIETDSLRHIDQMKSQFFANISHEFRTPLSLILGQLENVMSSGIDPEEKVKLMVADRNARRLLTLINQLLDLSKLEAGSMKLYTTQQDIASFLKILFYSFQPLADMKGITLSFESEPERIQFIFDADKIEKVFYNLVSNALKCTDENGKVRVKIHAQANDLEIRVENSGEGIPAEQIAFVFDRFYQVDSYATRNYEGTGIGLALARELVELHHGTIKVASDREITAFIVRLPGDRQQQIAMDETTNVANQDISSEYYIDTCTVGFKGTSLDTLSLPAETGEIVLIIEDNQEVREFICLQLAGVYQVKEAENGLVGFKMACELLPDLIISDVMMPEMDGFQFCKEIRRDERTSHIPIIMLTAKAGVDDKIGGLENGADDYITKPFSTKELKVRVRNLVNQRRLLRARFRQATVIHPSEVTAVNIDQAFLDRLIKTIEANYENADYSVDSLAREVNMSVSQLNRKLNALIDQPAGQLMRSLRLQRAAELLENNAGTVAQVCYQLGFSDQAYFSRAFKKQFGCSPSEYMKE